MQELRTRRVGRLFFRSLSQEGAALDTEPPERLEIEMRPGSRGELTAHILVAILVAGVVWAAVTAWQPFVGPLAGGFAFLFVILMIRARARRRVGLRLVAEADELRLEATKAAETEPRLSLDRGSVERVSIDEAAGEHTLWAETEDGERVVLFEGLTGVEADASAGKLRTALAL